MNDRRINYLKLRYLLIITVQGSDTMNVDDVLDVIIPVLLIEAFIIGNIACILAFLEMVGVI